MGFSLLFFVSGIEYRILSYLSIFGAVHPVFMHKLKATEEVLLGLRVWAEKLYHNSRP